MPYDDDPYYHLEVDDEPSSAKVFAAVITFILGIWVFALIGLYHVICNLIEALKRFFA